MTAEEAEDVALNIVVGQQGANEMIANIAAAIREAEAAMKERAADIVDREHEDPGDGPDAALTRAAAAIRALE